MCKELGAAQVAAAAEAVAAVEEARRAVELAASAAELQRHGADLQARAARSTCHHLRWDSHSSLFTRITVDHASCVRACFRVHAARRQLEEVSARPRQACCGPSRVACNPAQRAQRRLADAEAAARRAEADHARQLRERDAAAAAAAADAAAGAAERARLAAALAAAAEALRGKVRPDRGPPYP